MTDAADDPTLAVSARYAALAGKSAAQADAAARRGKVAVDSEDARAAKKARREAAEWCELSTKDAMRAHGALAAESGVFEAVHGGADEAMQRAIKGRDDAAAHYRNFKTGAGD